MLCPICGLPDDLCTCDDEEREESEDNYGWPASDDEAGFGE